jgi:hypothetical protein
MTFLYMLKLPLFLTFYFLAISSKWHQLKMVIEKTYLGFKVVFGTFKSSLSSASRDPIFCLNDLLLHGTQWQ